MTIPIRKQMAAVLLGLVASTLVFSGTAAAAEKTDGGPPGDGSVKCPKGETAYQGQCFGTMGGNDGGNNNGNNNDSGG